MSENLIKKMRTASDARYVVLLVMLIIIIRSVFCFRIDSLVQVSGADEFGTIAGAAFFGGIDWSSIVSANCPYYGFGYAAILFWLFGISDSSAFLHISMTFVNTLLLCCVGIMAYTIMRRHIGVKDKRLSFFAALASAVFFDSMVYANLVINETMLVFIIWLVMLIMLELNASKSVGVKIALNAALGIVCAYSMMVHTRSIIIICAVIVTIIMMIIYSGRSPVNIFIFGPILGIGYVISGRIIEMVQTVLWKAGEDTVLINSTGSVVTSLSYITRLFEPGGFRGFIYAVIGQLYMLFTLSGGLLAIGCIVGIVLFVYGFIVRKRSKVDGSDAGIKEYKPFGIIVSFIFSALLATLILNVVSALRLTPDIIMGNGVQGSQKWFVYVRYNALFCSPVIMLVFAHIYRYRESVKGVLNTGVMLFAAISAGFFYFVADYMCGVSSSRSGEFYFLFPLSNLKMGDEINIRCFITMSIVAVVVLCIIYLSMRFKAEWIGAVLFIILNVYIFGFISVEIHETNAQQVKSYSNMYEEVINDLEVVYEMPQIYLCRNNAGAMYAYSCQFALNHYSITEGLPEQDEEAIVLSIKVQDELFDMSSYKRYDLADNQHMYVKGAGVQAALDSIISEEFVDN